MTNEQVITRIKHNQMYKDDRETADYIIKALEQPSEDCVSREAVIDYLYTNMEWYDENGFLADDTKRLEDITNLINGVPRVTPTIPTCEDCVSRKDVLEMFGYETAIYDLPSVTPTRKVPREDITEDEVRINMLELALNQAKEHAESIEVLTDNHRLIFKAEKRGSENDKRN